MAQRLTAREILEDLDQDARTEPAFFPDFDHGYNYHVDGRLTAYGDGVRRWGIVIEQLAVNPRSGQTGRVATTLHYHGNCIELPPQPGWGDQDVQSISVIDHGPSGPIVEPQYSDRVNPAATDIRIRGKVIPIRTDSNYYWARKIDVEILTNEQVDQWISDVRRVLPSDQAEKKVREYEEYARPRVGKFELRMWHLMRGLVTEHRVLLLSTDAERRLGIPEGLAQLVQLDDWQHPHLLESELPSWMDSFECVARVLAGADPRSIEWPQGGNVHWSNWPHSGSL